LRVYKEVLAAVGVEYSLGVNLADSTRSITYFMVLRDLTQPVFLDYDCKLMAALIPHLHRALKLQRELGMIEFGKSAVVDALDTMALGIVIVDAEMRVKFTNHAAKVIAACSDGLRINGDRLVVEGRHADGMVQKVRQLTRSGNSGIPKAGESLMIQRPSGKEPFAVIISTLSEHQNRFGWSTLSEPLVIIYLCNPDEPHESRMEILQRLYGLAPSHARLADQLATGCPLNEAASRLHITTASARQYLKVIFHKTGTHSQTQLVRKVLLLPPAPKWRDQPATGKVT